MGTNHPGWYNWIDVGTGAIRVASAWTIAAVIAGCAAEQGRTEDSIGVPTTFGTATTVPGGEGDGSSSDGGAEGSSSRGGETEGGSAPVTTAADGAPASTGDDPSADGGGTTGSGDPILDGCLDLAVDACEQCGCNLCLDPLYACQQDPGCVAMRDCAKQAGCAGADCLEPCGAVIDMYGGAFGDSANRALALSDCLEGACPVCF